MNLIAILAILVAGVCTTAMNWRFSSQLGTTPGDSYTWATFSVALDVTKWVMLPCAALSWRNHKLRSGAAFTIWLVATIYSFTAAIGFAALNRETSVAERQAQADLYATLKVMQQSPRWLASAGCADATASLSKDFCARYTEARAKLNDLPQDAEPQATLFARITGFAPDTVRIILCIFLAIACESISALGLFAILPPSPMPERKEKAAPRTWRPPKWTEVVSSKLGHGAPRRAMTRHATSRRD